MRIRFVLAHVHVERQVAETERDAARFDGGVVGVGFFGAFDEGDVVLAGDVCGCVGYCWVGLVGVGRFVDDGGVCAYGRGL